MTTICDSLEALYHIEDITSKSPAFPATYKGSNLGKVEFANAFSGLPLAEQLKFIVECPLRWPENKFYPFGDEAKRILHDSVVEQSRLLDVDRPEGVDNTPVAKAAAFLLQDYRTDEIGYRAMLSIMARAAGCELNWICSTDTPKPVVALKYYEVALPKRSVKPPRDTTVTMPAPWVRSEAHPTPEEVRQAQAPVRPRASGGGETDLQPAPGRGH